ncbi:MAG: 6-phosphogluconolactonase [Spirochaetota bacterium]
MRLDFVSEESWLAAMVGDFEELTRAAMSEGRDVFHVSLAGGATPLPFYRRLAASPTLSASQGPRIHFWVGDERAVPPDSHERNGFAIAKALAPAIEGLAAWRRPPELHLWPSGERAQCAKTYAQEFLSHFPLAHGGREPGFDLSILGMGVDGHTAGIFPPLGDGGGEDEAGRDSKGITMLTQAPGEPRDRMTFSIRLLSGSAAIIVPVRGKEKLPALEAFERGEKSPIGLAAGKKGRIYYLET